MAKSLLEVLRDVSLDPNEQAAFSADPSGYLAQYGYEDVHPDDITEAFGLVADTLPPELAQSVSESQAAGQFGGGTVSAEEGLAGNGVPVPDFGAGYEPVDSDPGGADLVDEGGAGLDDFDGDTAFGEGVSDGGGDGGGGSDLSDLDNVADDSGLGDLADDSGLGDTGFGQGGDSSELDTDGADVGADAYDGGDYDDGAAADGGGFDSGTDSGGYDGGVGDGYAETHGYDDGGYESGTDAGGDYSDTDGGDSVGDVDDIGSF